MRIQLFGERCSGTNFIQSLIETNSDAQFTVEYGYKHSPPVVNDKKPDLIIVVARHAFSWVRSLHRTPWGAEQLKGLPFDEFLRAPWQVFYDEYTVGADSELVGTEMLTERDENGQLYCNVLKLRSGKFRHWLALSESHDLVICRLEDWQADPESQLRHLAQGRFQLRERFQPVEFYKGKERYGAYEPTTYEPLTAANAEWILWQLDLEIEEKLGYRPQ